MAVAMPVPPLPPDRSRRVRVGRALHRHDVEWRIRPPSGVFQWRFR